MLTANEIRLINEGLSYHVKKRDCLANTNTVGEYLRQNNLPVNFETVPEAIKAVWTRLIDSEKWQNAVIELREGRPDIAYNEAVLNMLAEVVDSDAELSSMSLTGDLLTLVLDEIDARQPFPRTDRFRADQAEIQERARLLQEISNGEATYSCRSNNDNRLSVCKTADLAEETTAVIRDVHNIVMSQRQVANMTLDEIKAHRKKAEFESTKALNAPRTRELPDQWVITQPIPATRDEEGWEAGCAVPTTPEIIRRLHRNDLMALIRNGGAQGAELVNERLGVKKPQQFGNVQVIRG